MTVSPQFRVSFDSNEYSVPWRLVNTAVTLRANQNNDISAYENRCVASHDRCWKKNEAIKNLRHEDGLREEKPGAQPDADLQAIGSIGASAKQYLEFLPAQTHSLRSEIKRLMVLITVFGAEAVEAVMGKAIAGGVVGHAHLERWLDQSASIEKKPPPLTLNDSRLVLPHQTPDLRSYDSRLLEAEPSEEIQKEKAHS